MIAKLVINKWCACFLSPLMFLYVMALPFIFRLFIPGFKGAAFPAILMFYILFGLNMVLEAQSSSKVFRLNLPVTSRQIAVSNFLYQASLILFSCIISIVFVYLSEKGNFQHEIISRAFALSLLVISIVTFAGNWISTKWLQVMGTAGFMLLFILTISGFDATLMSWLSLPIMMIAGFSVFILGLLISAAFPPRYL